jgi:DnaJ-class molecular chaperone
VIECPDCEGSGQDPDDGVALACGRCDGSGEIDPEEERWYAEVNRGIEMHRERHLDL